MPRTLSPWIRTVGTGTLVALAASLGCSNNGDREAAKTSGAGAPAVATTDGTTDERQPPDSVPAQPPAGERPAHRGVPMMTAQEAGLAARPGAPLVPLTPAGEPPGNAGAQQPSLLAKGAPAPDFVSLSLAGEELRPSQWRGKVVVLDFWATWCGPCLASFPHAQEIAANGKEHGVVVLAVCTSDTRDAFEQFVRANQEKYPDIIFACDTHERGSESFEQRASRALYGVSGLPTQFVLDREGAIANVLVGYDEGGRDLEKTLGELGVSLP